MAMDVDCWMYQWIDEFEIASAKDARRLLGYPRVIKRLYEVARGWKPGDLIISGIRQPMLVAGQGFNLTAATTCGCASCLRNEVDSAISKAWHYFDKVVVAGPNPAEIALQIESTDDDGFWHLKQEVGNYVDALLDLRETGAISRLIFMPNTFRTCDDCTREVAVEMGLSAISDLAAEERVISQIAQEARISIEQHREGLWDVDIDHEFLASPRRYHFSERPTRLQVAKCTFDEHCDAAMKDYLKAKMLNMPLATIARSNWLGDSSLPGSNSIEDRMGRVALQLELPVVNNLNGRDLLTLIDDERSYFARFQLALRNAIKEYISQLDTKSDEEVADAIVREYIEPELEDIYGRLRRSRKVLSKKTLAGLTLGTFTTSVGLVAEMPLVIATGVAAAATTLPQIYKYIDDSSEIEVSDMYFLWKTVAKGTHR